MSDQELAIFFANAKAEIPAEILPPRLPLDLDTASPERIDQQPRYVVTVAAVVDEVIPALRRVERGTLKSDECANVRHTLDAAGPEAVNPLSRPGTSVEIGFDPMRRRKEYTAVKPSR